MNILMTPANNVIRQTKITGVALFEILIALLVLSIGLLGLATMQSQGLRSGSSATMRTEATFLAMDIVDSMRASMTLPAGPPPAPPAPQPDPLIAPGYIVNTNQVIPAGASIVSQDLNQWTTALQNQFGGGFPVPPGVPSWNASIALAPAPAPAGSLIVTIMWDDERTGARGTNCGGDPTVDMTCFQTFVRP